MVGHTNAPGLRSGSLSEAYACAALRLTHDKSLEFVATFNPLPWHVAAATAVQREYGVPWISFLLDDVLHDPTLGRYVQVTRSAAGHVILSAAACERVTALLPGAAVLHLDGGIDGWLGDESGPPDALPRHVVYCGAHSKEAGMPLLVAAIPLVTADDVTFTITGDRGKHPPLGRLVARDRRVRTVGYLSDPEIDLLCSSATAFVNPRPPNHVASIASFPSKLMRYLAFGKPVASMWTVSLAEVYRPLLVVAEGNSPRALAIAIETAVTMDAADRSTLRERIRGFLVPGRLWTTQAWRFDVFLASVVQPGRRIA